MMWKVSLTYICVMIVLGHWKVWDIVRDLLITPLEKEGTDTQMSRDRMKQWKTQR